METRITEIMERFERIKFEINEWENSFKIWTVPAIELNRQFASFFKVICELSNQVLLARVLIPIFGAISSLKYVIVRIKRNVLKVADSQIDIAILRAYLSLECSFYHKLNLFTINPPSNRMQMTSEVIEIRDQN